VYGKDFSPLIELAKKVRVILFIFLFFIFLSAVDEGLEPIACKGEHLLFFSFTV